MQDVPRKVCCSLTFLRANSRVLTRREDRTAEQRISASWREEMSVMAVVRCPTGQRSWLCPQNGRNRRTPGLAVQRAADKEPRKVSVVSKLKCPLFVASEMSG